MALILALIAGVIVLPLAVSWWMHSVMEDAVGTNMADDDSDNMSNEQELF